MKAGIESRLASLFDFRESRKETQTVFIVEGGGEFRTDVDAFDYLRIYGAFTPDGRRIVRYPHPVEGIDPLSLSLYEMLDEAIKRGKLELPGVETC